MEEVVAGEPKGLDRSPPQPAAERAASALERIASFRFAYLAIFAFLVAYVFTLRGLERALTAHFSSAVVAAARVDPKSGSVATQIDANLRALLRESRWIRIGEVRVRPIVIAADGRTLLFVGDGGLPALPAVTGSGAHLLPASADVQVSIPYNSLLANGVLIVYAGLLIATLTLHTRRLAGRELAAVAAVTRARDAIAERAQRIERELAGVRARLASAAPESELHVREIAALEQERAALYERLGELEAREGELRRSSARAGELEQERQALEQLLDEASRELETKDGELAELRAQVKQVGKLAARSAKDAELLSRRFAALYKQLEVDARAVDDIVALGDESLRLRAEEALKRLSDDPENTLVRRKVGGLPPHLSIFELGFAGKGRIYYTQGAARRFRVLAVGAKNSQNADLEYLSRLPKGT
jgi:predicted  nucleic acid-binding Zn-ribbon protein